jgi:hypothetical protein
MTKNYPTPKHTKLVKTIIYKLTDSDDIHEPPYHFTLNGLRNHTINVLWDKWDNMMSENETQDFTQEEIYESDEYLFAYLDSWNYCVERIGVVDIK